VRSDSGEEVAQPRRYWGHIFREGPGWVWLRPDGGRRLRATAYSGPIGLTIDEEVGAEGVFISLAFMDPDWPGFIVLEEPGWVDFGRGVLPTWLDRPVKSHEGLRDTYFTAPDDRSVSYYIEQFRLRDRGDPATLRDRLRSLVDPVRWDSLEASFRRSAECPVPPGTAVSATGPYPPRTADERRLMHRRLREARGLSQSEAAAQATELLTGDREARSVTLHQVHNYEIGRASRIRHLPALLDLVYGAFGWTCFEPVAAERVEAGHFRVTFPHFWLGPVCVTASPSATEAPAGEITFNWARWGLVRELPAAATSFAFYCMPNTGVLDIQVPPGWKVETHMGQNPDALDANSDWVPVDEAAGNEIFEEYLAGFLRLVGKTRDDLARALGD
jgi:hypothetical protein